MVRVTNVLKERREREHGKIRQLKIYARTREHYKNHGIMYIVSRLEYVEIETYEFCILNDDTGE